MDPAVWGLVKVNFSHKRVPKIKLIKFIYIWVHATIMMGKIEVVLPQPTLALGNGKNVTISSYD